ncbi:hypothetical protein CR513_43846, partial [Mucuna pruriens]
MGNSIRRVGVLSSVGVGWDHPFHFQLGREVAMELSRREVEVNRGGKHSEKWTLKYITDDSCCEFKLMRCIEKDGSAKGLVIEHCSKSSKNNIPQFSFRLGVHTTTETNVVVYPRRFFGNGTSSASTVRIKQSKQVHAGGRVTETDFCLYEIGDKGGFIVVQRNKKFANELPFAVTVAHYFAAATTGINTYADTKINFGVSLVAKIRASNGHLDLTVEGPDQHPAFGLFYLFDQVMISGIWKPTMCPHCATSHIQDHSETEDSDSVTVAHRRGPNPRRIANDGLFVGNGNGNFIDNMGNSVGSGGLLSNVGDKGPYRVQLGKHAAIELSTRQDWEKSGGFSDVWTMSYGVDVSSCVIKVTKQCDKGGNGKGILLELHSKEPSKGDGNTSTYYYRSDIEAGHTTDILIHHNRFDFEGRSMPGGKVTDTAVYLYGVKHKGGLIVVEKKKENEDKLPYAVTVAHYYANSTGFNILDKVDFGLSVVAKFRATSGKLDIKQVSKSGIWDPTICLHCAHNRRLQHDSEDSDCGSVKSRHGRQKNPRSLANDGAFVGDGNGNFFERNIK